MGITILCAALGGSAVAALINQLGEWLRHRRDRRERAKDACGAELDGLKTAMRYVLLDRIRHLGQAYLLAGCVDFDDRRLLREMHEVYHNNLGGNGDLDDLMRQVAELPLRPQA